MNIYKQKYFLLLATTYLILSCNPPADNKAGINIHTSTKIDTLSIELWATHHLKAPYHTLNISDPWNVEWIVEDTNTVRTNPRKAKRSYMWVSNKNDQLSLEVQTYSVKNNKEIPIDLPKNLFEETQIQLLKKEIRTINISDKAYLTATSPIEQDSLFINLSHGADIDLNVDTKYIGISAAKNARIRLRGFTQTLDLYTHDNNVALDLQKLKTKHLNHHKPSQANNI